MTRKFADLNFKVSPEFHQAFKTTAVMRGMSMKELLEASFKQFTAERVIVLKVIGDRVELADE